MLEGALAPWHVIVLVLVVTVVFGSRRLPEVARSLGQSMRILRAEMRADDGRASVPPALSPDGGPAAQLPPQQPPAPDR